MSGTNSIMTFEPSATQRTGAIVVAVFALVSTLALMFIAIRLATVICQPDRRNSRSPETLFFRTQLGHYSGCLVLSNLLISVAGLINFSWASGSGLSGGPACSSQAVLTQVGVWGTCWFTVALGVHSLNTFVFRIHQARWHSAVVVIVGWAIAFVAGLVPLQKNEAYGPIGPSCGIALSYSKDVFALEVLPIILTAFASITVYSAIFIVLHGKLNTNGAQRQESPNSTGQREDRFDEYYGFIRTIICTMFWFPLAFVLLLLPFCIAHALMYAGQSVPPALNIFADVCVALLGFVNVCLLWNTIRVINPVYRGPHGDKGGADTVKTFGNDASGESPIDTPNKSFSQPKVLSHENDRRIHSHTQPSSNHSRDSSWASADSNTGLLRVEKASYKSVQTKVAPLPSPTPWLGRQLSVDEVGLGFHSSRVSLGTIDTQSEVSTEDQHYSFQPKANTDVPRKGVRELTFRCKAPPSLDLSPLPVLPHPLSARNVTNKSATLAARLGIPAASPHTPLQTVKAEQGNARVAAFPVTPVPRIEVDSWSPEYVDAHNSQLSPSSSSHTIESDCDAASLGEIIHIRPLSQTPEPREYEQDVADTRSPSPQFMQARSQRATMVSVWSQESGYTMTQPDAEAQEAYQQLSANLLTPKAIPVDQTYVGGTTKRQTPSGPRACPKTSSRVMSTLSASLPMLSPRSPLRSSSIVIAPNDSIV